MENANVMSFIFLIIGIQAALGQRYEYDVCQKGATKNLNHICLKLHSCPSAIAGLRKGLIPKFCGYSKNIPIVCCPPNATAPIRSATSIANEMCNKYKEAQFRLEVHEGPLLGDDSYTEKVNDCFEASETLIIGGEKAQAKEFPHMALLGYGESKSRVRWLCGGTLISEQFVLTAGHCINNLNAGPAKWVRLGELNYANDTDGALPVDFEVIQAIPHPNYSSPAVYNDIALLKLSKNVSFNAHMRPACLDTSSKLVESTAIATGWGVPEVGYTLSEDLLKVSLHFVPNKQCRQFMGTAPTYPNGIDEKSQLCAGENEGGKDTCQGDSGGPLQLRLGNEPCMYVQVGVTSFGNTFCGLKDNPGIYTKVYNYLDWIQSVVWPQ